MTFPIVQFFDALFPRAGEPHMRQQDDTGPRSQGRLCLNRLPGRAARRRAPGKLQPRKSVPTP